MGDGQSETQPLLLDGKNQTHFIVLTADDSTDTYLVLIFVAKQYLLMMAQMVRKVLSPVKHSGSSCVIGLPVVT